MPSELVVVCVGGHALLRKGSRGALEEHLDAARYVAEVLAQLVERGQRLVITHGNGPQVGAGALRHEAGEKIFNVPQLPLYAITAETQGFLGYILQQAFQAAVKHRGLHVGVATVVTQVVVGGGDEAFKNPTKPIGFAYSLEGAKELRRSRGYVFVEDKARGGWRRVVPSPKPIRIVELDAIKALVGQGLVVIACGGGGIPVIETENGYMGVEAVIDKDYTSQLLASSLGANRLIFITDVDGVYLHFGTKDQVLLRRIKASELERMIQEKVFPPGSMGPKLEASLNFIKNGGSEVIITSTGNVVDALDGKAGTTITN